MENKAIILEKIASARKLKLRQVYFTVPEATTPAAAEFLPVPRLIVILSGAKRALLPLAAGRTELQLETGDMLYCLPCSWEKHDWSGLYEMLCIVPRKDFLRVSFYDHKSLVDGSRPESLFHHTGLPYNETMRNTINALNSAGNISDINVVHSLAKALLGMAEHECQRAVENAGGRPEMLFNRIRNWTANSFQEEINRSLVAKVFNVSSGYISQLFKAHCGCTFQAYLTQCRMDHARDLLERTDLTVYQVADQCGFQNYVHFVRRFRELNGISPGKYRENIN
jgi:AraC-like DNA-binding protein